MRSSVGLELATLRNSTAWKRILDIFAVLTAVALPWSTSLVAIFVVIWLLLLVPTIDPPSFVSALRRPICALPITLCALAIVGTLWSDASWSARIYATGPTAKLLVLPALLYHFARSSRGAWVLVGFLASCTALLLLSWIISFHPQLTIKPIAEYGVPVKNYIDQSQEFALCAVALIYIATNSFLQKKFVPGILAGVLSLGFILNMTYVVVSRTALFTTPVMLFIFALLHLRFRGFVITVSLATALMMTAWFTSSVLRERIGSVASQYDLYQRSNAITSVGERLEFWRKSVSFFKDSPVYGHGTGSTRGLFAQAALGQIGAAGEVIGNPHNQTLNVAVQWGALGIVLLYAMWLVHLSLFRGIDLGSSIGLLVVIQNMITSLFNSHLFDFHEGWMYVFGVGICGGMVLKRKWLDSDGERLRSA